MMSFFGWITQGTRNAVLKGLELAAADLGLHYATDDDESPLAALTARMKRQLPAPARSESDDSRPARKGKPAA